MGKSENILSTKRLVIREIKKEDARFIVKCRNSKMAYKYFKTPKKITVENHLEWYENIYLNDKNRIDFLLIEKNNLLPIGVFGFTFKQNKCAEISYILDSEYFGKGYMSEGLNQLCYWAQNELHIKEFIAEIYKDNENSIHFIKNNGFHYKKNNGLFQLYVRKATVLIRTDASKQIGSGHVMRCRSLAFQLKARGYNCIFITKTHETENFLKYEFECLKLKSELKVMTDEISDMKFFIDKYIPLFLILDSYEVTNDYINALNSLKNKPNIMLFDDFGKNVYDVKFLVNYNISACYKDYLELYKGKDINLLIGTKFIPFREEFKNIVNHDINKKVTNVLFSAGGSDPMGVTEKVLQMWKQMRMDNVVFHVVIGRLNINTHSIKEMCVGLDNVVLHIDEKKMKDLMLLCDVAISAAGSTLYELAICRVPTIMYVLAENQKALANSFQDREIMINIGTCDQKNFINLLERELNDLITNEELRSKLYKKMCFIDDLGCDRIINSITGG